MPMLLRLSFKGIWIVRFDKVNLWYTRNVMFKNVISPIQAWLLSQGRCVGCGKELSDGKKSEGKAGDEKVTCSCGRIFIQDKDTKKYRRALLEEV